MQSTATVAKVLGGVQLLTLFVGDTIVEVNNRAVKTPDDVFKMFCEWDKLRGEQAATMTVRLINRYGKAAHTSSLLVRPGIKFGELFNVSFKENKTKEDIEMEGIAGVQVGPSYNKHLFKCLSGDIITHMASHRIEKEGDLFIAMNRWRDKYRKYSHADMTCVVIRRGRPVTLTIKGVAVKNTIVTDLIPSVIRDKVSDSPPKTTSKGYPKEVGYPSGLYVQDVISTSPLKGKVFAGDVILAINNERVRVPADVNRLVNERLRNLAKNSGPGPETVTFRIKTAGSVITMAHAFELGKDKTYRIGAEVAATKLIVDEIYKHSPWKNIIHKGDMIWQVNNVRVYDSADLYKIVREQGKAGRQVNLTVKRKNAPHIAVHLGSKPVVNDGAGNFVIGLRVINERPLSKSSGSSPTIHYPGGRTSTASATTTVRKDEEWSSEAGGYVKKDRVFTLKRHGKRLIHEGVGNIGFCQFEDAGFTTVRLIDTKARELLTTTYSFNGKPSIDDIREALFKSAKTPKSLRKETQTPYKMMYRHAFVPLDDWNQMHEWNIEFTKYKKDDKELKSLSEMVSSEVFSSGEFAAGTPHLAHSRVMAAIRGARRKFAKSSDKPVVELYAIWSNYDPDADLILSNYNDVEPLTYNKAVFNTAEEITKAPM